MHTDINGNKIVVTESSGENHASIALESPLFLEWKKKLDRRFGVTSIEFDVVDFRGEKNPDKVLFARFRAQTALSERPQIAELRGDTSVMLVNLKRTSDGKVFTVLVEQARFPIGDFQHIEAPAGMTDGGDPRETALREIVEELGTEMFSKSALRDITGGAHAYESKDPRNAIALSPGLLDEKCRFYFTEKWVHESVIEEMPGKHTGVQGEGESITLRIVPIDDVPLITSDAKTLLVYFFYKAWMAKLEEEMQAHKASMKK